MAEDRRDYLHELARVPPVYVRLIGRKGVDLTAPIPAKTFPAMGFGAKVFP